MVKLIFNSREHGKTSATSGSQQYTDGNIIEVSISGKKLKFENKSTKHKFEVVMENKKYKLAILLYYTNSYVELTKSNK
jgi:hypothetical protein